MTSAQKRSKDWGYAVEVAALKALKPVFPGLRRTGSMAYKKAAADLVQETDGVTLPIVVTRDKRKPLLVTLAVSDFVELFDEAPHVNVVVQVKGREKTWIGRLYDDLREATKR